jgi:hypothetical protein
MASSRLQALNGCATSVTLRQISTPCVIAASATTIPAVALRRSGASASAGAARSASRASAGIDTRMAKSLAKPSR